MDGFHKKHVSEHNGTIGMRVASTILTPIFGWFFKNKKRVSIHNDRHNWHAGCKYDSHTKFFLNKMVFFKNKKRVSIRNDTVGIRVVHTIGVRVASMILGPTTSHQKVAALELVEGHPGGARRALGPVVHHVR